MFLFSMLFDPVASLPSLGLSLAPKTHSCSDWGPIQPPKTTLGNPTPDPHPGNRGSRKTRFIGHEGNVLLCQKKPENFLLLLDLTDCSVFVLCSSSKKSFKNMCNNAKTVFTICRNFKFKEKICTNERFCDRECLNSLYYCHWLVQLH